MGTKLLKKTLSIILVISALLSGIMFFIINKGYDIDSKSIFIQFCSKIILPLLLELFFIVLIIKSSITDKTRWTKWVCVTIGGLMLILLNYYVVKNLPDDTTEWVLTALIELLFIPFLLLPLLIKKSYWTKWLLVAYSFIGFIIASIIFVIIIDKNLNIEVESYVTYRNSDNDREYVAMFSNINDSTTSKEYYVEKYPLLIKKRPFAVEDLTGKWIGYNENGEIISDCTYNEGEIIQSRPIIPKDARLVKSSHDFMSAVKNDTIKLAILGKVNINGNIVIRDKKELSFKGIESTEEPGIYSKNGAVSVTFTNCNNININNLHFNFLSKITKPFMLSFKNCKNVEISNCSFNGNCDYSLYFDKECSDIVINQNLVEGYKEYGIRLYSKNNVTIDENRYYYDDVYDDCRKIWFADITKPDISNLRFDESIFEIDNEWLFDQDNYETMDFKGETIGAYTSNCSDIQYGFDIYKNLTLEFFPSLISSDIGFSANTLAFISGINPLASSASYSDKLEFSHVNPEFVNWAATRINENIVSQQFYDIVLKHFSRLFCESYLYLNKNENLSELIDNYTTLAINGDVQKFLCNRYNKTLTHYIPNYSEEDDNFDPDEMSESAHMMGFWIRRMIDGSDKSFRDAAVKFMTIYDYEWLEETETQYKK